MMTSAPTYPAAVFTPSVLSDDCTEDENAAAAVKAAPAVPDANSISLRLVKRPLAGHFLESCKKRRKQSTPIRISTSADSISDENVNTVEPEGKLGSFLTSPEHSPLGAPALVPPQFVANSDPAQAYVKTENSESRQDSDSKPKTEANEGLINLSGSQSFPSWMSDMQNKSEDWLGASSFQSIATNAASVFLSNIPHYSQIDVNPSSQLRSANQPPIRIFNPEAYCELCNKEFCNKYFLKTHKANKHRIYSDPPVSEITGIPVNIPNFVAPSFKKNIALPCSDTASKSSDIGKPLVSYSSLFCDICGKGFSNKPSLISHKVSAHGLITEQEQCSESNDMEPVDFKQKDEQESDNSDMNQEENSGIKENILLKNGYSGLGEVLNVKEESNTEKEDMSLNVQATQQLRDNIDLSANRLRRLGIMNPDAFCEICRKEYCNKYFLRTHKMKRHGLIIHDDNSKDNQKDLKLELSISNSWYQMQTSPLNLIMNEQNTNSSGSGSERKSSPINEIECEICGLRFQTAYLAQLHSAAVHSKSNKDTSELEAVANESFIKAEENVTIINNNEKQIVNAADSISEDLQKLQTMILQLNDLDVSKVGSSCNICNKELENRYYLHAHMMTEHGILLEEKDDDKQHESEFALSTKDTNLCKICGRDGFTLDALKQHVSECHGGSGPTLTNLINLTSADIKDDSNGFSSSDKSSNRTSVQMSLTNERRLSMTLTPTNSYCEICNKELCNKYFMKTHMQRMHGIEIENGAQIGGVVCNICNKELCSKYFLRVHKHNTHGIVEDSGSAGVGAGVNNTLNNSQLRLSNEVDISSQLPLGLNEQCRTAVDQALKPGDLSDLSHRYFTHFTEVCSICSRRFRSTKWLKAHLLGDHGKIGADKWNELELQLQQSVNQQLRKSDAGHDRTSPILWTPNDSQEIGNGTKANVQNVLSSLFGTNDSNAKHYQCSFCAFSTPILAFLFVHEKSHSRQSTDNSNVDEIPLKCPVCNQSFRQSDELNHHVMIQHPFLSLSQYFGTLPQPSQLPAIVDDVNETKSNQKELSVSTALPDSPEQTDFRCVKCTQCGKSKKPVRVGMSVKQNEISADVSLTLKDVSKQRQLPTSYALPQRQQQQTKYMMQAFLMDEPANTSNTNQNSVPNTSDPSASSGLVAPPLLGVEQHRNSNDNESNNMNGNGNGNGSDVCDRRFAPSIVFLPVLERLTAPLTVSFTLTPA